LTSSPARDVAGLAFHTAADLSRPTTHGVREETRLSSDQEILDAYRKKNSLGCRDDLDRIAGVLDHEPAGMNEAPPPGVTRLRGFVRSRTDCRSHHEADLHEVSLTSSAPARGTVERRRSHPFE